MATLVFFAYAASVQLYRITCVLVTSRFSIRKCVNYICETRQKHLDRRYLDSIDIVYGLHLICANRRANGIECVVCKKRKSQMYAKETDEFIEIERCEEAFEIISSYEVRANRCPLHVIKSGSKSVD